MKTNRVLLGVTACIWVAIMLSFGYVYTFPYATDGAPGPNYLVLYTIWILLGIASIVVLLAAARVHISKGYSPSLATAVVLSLVSTLLLAWTIYGMRFLYA